MGNRDPSAEKTVKKHIKLLHDYNELRDVGLGLIGTFTECLTKTKLD